MKRLCIMAMIAALFAAVSCQKENVKASISEDEAVATFSIDLPAGLATKAIGDGSVATDLYYGVFSQDMKYIESLKQAEVLKVVNNKAQLKLKLVRNYTYTLVFWAQAPQAPYTFDAKSGIVKVDYKGKANDLNRDAFCGVYTFEVPDAATFDGTVTLKRPFAQINFAADDFAPIAELGLSMQSTIEVAGLADTYNILTGEVSGSASTALEASIVPAQFSPAETLEVGGKEYGYVSMNYILAPVNEYDKDGNVIVAQKELANVRGNFTYNNKTITLDVPNVPYQRNFRTNIVGTMFTGEADLTIIVDPAFHKQDIVTPIQ